MGKKWYYLMFLALSLLLLMLPACGDGGGNETPVATTTGTPVPASETTPAIGAENEIFNNWNTGGVDNNPTSPTTFTLTDTYKITSISDYHWNYSQGASPGTIGLTDNNGRVIGTWHAIATSGQGGAPNVSWDVKPNIVIGPGTYTVVDSDSATWSQNSLSNNKGFTLIKGVVATSAVSSKTETPTIAATQSPSHPTTTGTPVATTPLVSKELEPSANAQLVSYQDTVGVIIPGDTVDSAQTVTISPAPNLPAYPFKGFTELAAYDISMENIREFKNPLTIEIAYDPAQIPFDMTPDKALSVGYWDTDQNVWVSAPFAVDTTRNVIMIPTTHLTCWKIWAATKGWKYEENDHFVVFYDPTGTVLMGGTATGTSKDLAIRVASILDQAYISYDKAGFNMSLTYVPASALGAGVGVVAGGAIGWVAGGIGVVSGARAGLNAGGRIGAVIGAVVVGSKTNVFLDKDTIDPNWSRYTGDISVPLDFDSYDHVSLELRHEFFHAVQNSYFTIQGMDSRRWWMEATADYAAYKVAGIVNSTYMSQIFQTYFTQPLTTVNDVHEYQSANLVDYLVGTGTDPGKQFKEMFEAVAKGDASVFTPLNSYIKDKTGKTIAEQYRDFTAHAIFDSSGSLEKFKDNLLDSKVTEGPQLLKASDNQLSHEFSLKGNYTAGVWGFKVEPKDANNSPRAINIETNDKLPADVLLNVYVLKNDQRPQGGVNPTSTMSVTAAIDDVVYIVATNGTNSGQDFLVKVSDAPTGLTGGKDLSWDFNLSTLTGQSFHAKASANWQVISTGASLSGDSGDLYIEVYPDMPIHLVVTGQGTLLDTMPPRMEEDNGSYALVTYKVTLDASAPVSMGKALGIVTKSAGSVTCDFTLSRAQTWVVVGFWVNCDTEYYNKDNVLQSKGTGYPIPAGSSFTIYFTTK